MNFKTQIPLILDLEDGHILLDKGNMDKRDLEDSDSSDDEELD